MAPMLSSNALKSSGGEQSDDPIGAYLMAVDECSSQGVGSSACARAVALQSAALAAGLDPNIANAARSCIEAGDVEGCAKAATSAGLTAACVAATEGAGSAVCGPLAAIVVNFAWPVIWGTLSAAYDVASSLVSVGLEAVGLKDAPEFADLAGPMQANAIAQFQSSITESAKAIAGGIQKSRAAIGMSGDNSIFVRKSRQSADGLTWKWTNEGTYMWLDAAAESLIWDRLANDSRFVAGYTSNSSYGIVGLNAGSMGSDRKANIESAYTLISLHSWWSVSWKTAWQRDDCFNTGANALSRFYGHRFEALQEAIASALKTMISLEAVNPNTVKALDAKKQADLQRAAGLINGAPKESGTGGALLAVGILAALGAGGYALWRKYGKTPVRRRP